ncbi:MAG: PQQ-dependent dehydrogenase, methanol/ethanol family [Spongiibacteraceae bacterium]|jgi:quinohemoprotein ethanol dehydrogenase|nr:PQQ-dependent dehydrogenase, methanol/ethanol family [Spongiibacteraceae bacterium]
MIKLRHLFLTSLLLSPTSWADSTVVDNALLAGDPDGVHWAGYGRGFDEQRYSPLDQINTDTVKQLRLASYLDLADMHTVTTVPLAVDGIIYFAAGYSVIHAVDAKSGKLLWRYDPEIWKTHPDKLRRAWGSRGLAIWKGLVYVGTVDGRLIAVDTRTGKPVWSVATTEANDSRYVTGAPRVFNDKVIIGHGGAEYGAVRGYVTAYDSRTGKQVWRFYITPGNPADGFENEAMAMAAKTWTGEWWKFGGGGTVWNAMTYDPEFNRIYLGTGNGSPWNRKIRSPGGGDNLFLSSVLALDADTGEYAWHYQTNPGETWDYNSSMDMVLATVALEGKQRKVLMHAPKNGFFYVIDREDGQLISAEKIVKATWAEKINVATGRPVEAPNARYENGPVLLWPGSTGAHSWHPMAFSPLTGLAYLPAREVSGYYSDEGVDKKSWTFRPGFNFANGLGAKAGSEVAPTDQASCSLLAWNPVTQTEAWRIPTPGAFGGGIMTTGGNLVMQADAEGKLNAYRADNGELLWSYDLGVGTLSPPITYLVDDKQYVSILVGWAGAVQANSVQAIGAPTAHEDWVGREQPRRLLTFTLDGKATLPKHQLSPPVPIHDPGFKIDAWKAARGEAVYGMKNCVICHGVGAVAGGYAPDLRASAVPLSADGFALIVREGALQPRGMPAFSELTDSDLEAMQHYIRKRAHEAIAE